MSISKGFSSIDLNEILNNVSEEDILYYYLNISRLPVVIKSPFREDKNPSFSLFYSKDRNRILYYDFSSRECGNLYTLLGKLWNTDYNNVLNRLSKDILNIKPLTPNLSKVPITKSYKKHTYNESRLECKIREWQDYDLEYWKSFGISKKWLEYADVYPISHKIIIKNDKRYIFKADKYAYVYVERKEGNITMKIYQPFNKKGYKWSNKHDSSVISLWTKIPKYGDILCICSSLKDALCLWENTGIPSIAVQGEGYTMSNTAIQELKKRYKFIYILFDNDEAGLIDGVKLANQTGFTNLILPHFENGKDISDLYKSLNNKEQFKLQILKLFNYEQKRTLSEN